MALNVAESFARLRALQSETAQQLHHHQAAQPNVSPHSFGRDFQDKGQALVKLYARLHAAHFDRYQQLQRATGRAREAVHHAQQAENQHTQALRGVL